MSHQRILAMHFGWWFFLLLKNIGMRVQHAKCSVFAVYQKFLKIHLTFACSSCIIFATYFLFNHSHTSNFLHFFIFLFRTYRRIENKIFIEIKPLSHTNSFYAISHKYKFSHISHIIISWRCDFFYYFPICYILVVGLAWLDWCLLESFKHYPYIYNFFIARL